MTEDLSVAYANGDFIPGSEAMPARWAAQAAAFREDATARCTELRYGEGDRHVLDLFLPDTDAAPRGLVVFIHGGYWMAFDKSNWSHYAAGPLAQGWAVALPSYTLAPHARIADMTHEVAAAIGVAARAVDGPIVVTGHSAGGHLSARLGCTDQTHDWTPRLRRVVPISPLSDLRPLMQTGMNETLHLDAAEAESESPALLAKRADVACTVWVGGQERPSFLWQARLLSENWNCPWHVAPGLHHFNVIEDLTDPHSLLTQTLLA